MNRPLLNVVDINPHNKARWTVIIQVLENGHVQQSRSGGDFKRIIASDTQGTKLTLLIYSNLRQFANTLVPYRRYYISNAVVIPNDNRFRLSTYPFSWILNSRTPIEEVVEAIPPVLACSFEFTKFNDLHRYADSDNLQNVRALVLRCLPVVEHGTDLPTRRDLVIVNEEKRLLLLTLWNDFETYEGARIAHTVDTRPLIFSMKVKVTTFNCLSLTTRGASGLMINPPVTETLQLHEWYNANHDEVEHLLEAESFKNHALLLPYPSSEEIVSIETANTSLHNLRPVWVKGNINLSINQRSYWFTACANCNKSLDADVTWVVTCPCCKVESEVILMSRLMIDIVDGSGTLQSMLCSPEVEHFIPFSALQLKDSEEMGVNVRSTIQTSIQHQSITAFVRAFELTVRGQTEVRATVVKAYKSVSTPTRAFESPSASASTTNETATEETPQSVPSIAAVASPASPVASGKKQLPSYPTKDVPIKKTKPSST